ncbi:mycofactocin biosynthesis glycosyltransferase MftF [Microbacterium awajiense]|uniref:Mycofactocin biosynthesis glycosyltransferase MftF n=1 Tax=Microbacterium awajiense TaxID=415214 RepID=A0ABP7AL23_9MICO
MSAQLPDGFTVRLSRRTEVREGGAVLVGGWPTRVLRLNPGVVAHVRDREVTVADAASRALVERLMAAGVAEPVAASLPEGSLAEVTVVVPVHERAAMLDRLLGSLPAGLGGVVVVDDASADPSALREVAARHGADLVRLDVNVGSGAARNAGLARVITRYVAFVDSDVVIEAGCLETLLRHFADPEVAMVAPRVIGLERARPNWITRYENARSSLDLGGEPATVRPRSPVAWVSSTCLVARVDALGDGFDARMRVGEDVDLVWRLADAGRRVRYEPAATVLHEHRTRVRPWLGRKFFYGTGAAPLGERHPSDIAPAVLAPWGALALAALFAQRRWSVPVIAATGAVVAVRIARRLTHVREPWPLATRLTGQGLVAALAQGVALLVRHWWPAAVAGALVSRRARRALAVAAVVDVAWEYVRLRPALDPLRFGLARRLDDLAYGAGVWWSALRARSPRALLPAIVRGGLNGRASRSS